MVLLNLDQLRVFPPVMPMVGATSVMPMVGVTNPIGHICGKQRHSQMGSTHLWDREGEQKAPEERGFLLFIWDRSVRGIAVLVEPKSVVSTNSTTPARRS